MTFSIRRGRKELAEAPSLRAARGAARCLLVEDGERGPLDIHAPDFEYKLETCSYEDGRFNIQHTSLSRRYL